MKPFRIDIPQAKLDDLHRRLENTRWPSEISGAGWDRGVPLDYLKELSDYWRTTYDWREAEARLNKFPQFVTEIDGANIHFFHVRSPEPDALPLIMSHGWPGSVAEYLEVMAPLADPRGHGGAASDAFHLVIPSLPGFGFSGPVEEAGWRIGRIAGAWAELMRRLGYDRYVAHGGDLGSWVSLELAGADPGHLAGSHVTFLLTPPSGDPAEAASLSEQDRSRLAVMRDWLDHKSGYMKIQATRPQTLAYGLTDSPAGQLAWIVEKFYEWTDAAKAPEDAVSRDALLTNVSIYWLTGTAGSSAQLYYEMADMLPNAPVSPGLPPPIPVPLGVAVYAGDAAMPTRSLASTRFPNIIQWSEFDRGGHFPAMEEPDLFVADLRSFARALPPRR